MLGSGAGLSNVLPQQWEDPRALTDVFVSSAETSLLLYLVDYLLNFFLVLCNPPCSSFEAQQMLLRAWHILQHSPCFSLEDDAQGLSSNPATWTPSDGATLALSLMLHTPVVQHLALSLLPGAVACSVGKVEAKCHH